MNADEQLVVSGLWLLDVAKLEHFSRAVVVLNDGFHDCRLLPSSIALSAPAFSPIFKTPMGLSTDCRASIPGRYGRR
jgi:hypothetical protein